LGDRVGQLCRALVQGFLPKLEQALLPGAFLDTMMNAPGGVPLKGKAAPTRIHAVSRTGG